jgi:hypothetical protein
LAVPATPQELFERYIWTGLIRDADARAEMFTMDGVLEAPLIPAGHIHPRRLEGREEIRAGLAAHYQRLANHDLTVNTDQSRYVLHITTDPDVFIAEIDAALDVAGETTTLSAVQIFRIHDGKIAMMREYFAPDAVD